MQLWKCLMLLATVITSISNVECQKQKKKPICFQASFCMHDKIRRCGLEPKTREVRWFLNKCDILEFNCEYKTILLLIVFVVTPAVTHGPPSERDNEDIAMGRKMGAKWCGMAKVCNHDRVPVCGLSHAGDLMGFRDLCDMFDYNCLRRRNYKQTACPDDKSILTASRRPTNSYYDD